MRKKNYLKMFLIASLGFGLSALTFVPNTSIENLHSENNYKENRNNINFSNEINNEDEADSNSDVIALVDFSVSNITLTDTSASVSVRFEMHKFAGTINGEWFAYEYDDGNLSISPINTEIEYTLTFVPSGKAEDGSIVPEKLIVEYTNAEDEYINETLTDHTLFDYDDDEEEDVSTHRGIRKGTVDNQEIELALYDDTFEGNSYYIGYGDNADNYIPAELVYDVKVGNKTETRTTPVNLNSKTSYYDAIGKPDAAGDAIGGETVNSYVDIPLLPGEELITDEFSVINVAKAVKDETGKFNPEKDANGNIAFKSIKEDPEALKRVYSFNDLVSLEFIGSSSFYGYKDFAFVSSGFGQEQYESLGAQYRRMYATHSADIEAGISWIRTRLNFSNNTIFNFYMKDGSLIQKNAISQQIDVTSGNVRVGVLYDGVDPTNVENITVYNLNLNVDIYNSELQAGIKNSVFSARFATYDCHLQPIVDYNGDVAIEAVNNPYYVDSTLIVVLPASIFAFIYLTTSAVLYFYLKKKNRNDEFKRMNTKQYWETNLMGLVAIESILLLITTITLRSTLMLSSFRVYNELDIYIVFTGVCSIIFGGYFIKYFVTMYKNYREKKRVDKLNLNKDSIDDGTLVMPNK